MIPPSLIPYGVVALIGLGGWFYVTDLQADHEKAQQEIKDLEDDKLDLTVDKIQLERKLTLKLKEERRKAAINEKVLTSYYKKVEESSKEISKLKRAMEAADAEVKECLDTPLPDDILDRLFPESAQSGDPGSGSAGVREAPGRASGTGSSEQTGQHGGEP